VPRPSPPTPQRQHQPEATDPGLYIFQFAQEVTYGAPHPPDNSGLFHFIRPLIRSPNPAHRQQAVAEMRPSAPVGAMAHARSLTVDCYSASVCAWSASIAISTIRTTCVRLWPR